MARPTAGLRSGSESPETQVGNNGFTSLQRPLVGFMLVLLAALVLVPVLIGRHSNRLREHQATKVIPARQALQESRTALTEQLAAVRGYVISGERLYLARLRDAVSASTPAIARLMSLTEQVGSEAAAAADEFSLRASGWQQSHQALLNGEASRAELVAALDSEQQHFEAALDAAGRVGEALEHAAMQLDRRIQAAEQTERTVTVMLAVVGLAAALLMIWLTNRLRLATRQLHERAESLRESEERFRLIAENLREMIWISDPAYSIQYYLSPAYERIWGSPLNEARTNPRSFLQSVLPEDREHVEAALARYARGEYAAEYRITRPDDEVRWISARAYPVRDEDGTIFRVAGIAEDITEQKRAEEELERLLERERAAREESDSALRLRDQVVRIVSHDLKNPLHTIGMAAELLEMPLPPDQREKQFAIIRRTVARANRMVSDLLDAARLQAGRSINVQLQPLDVGALLAEASDAFVFQAQEKSQQLTFDAAVGILPVLGDADRLLQALINLIGNAVKFTPEGGRIHVAAESDGEGHVRLSVADTGPGIAAELLPHLFEPFSQARDTASLGTGLGLAITRGIVDAHGGRIAVDSEPGTGTTFTITLPAAPSRDDTISRSTDGRRSMVDRRKQNDGDRRRSRERGNNNGERKLPDPSPHQPAAYPDPVDDALDDSFPASDPPQWWAGDDSD